MVLVDHDVVDHAEPWNRLDGIGIPPVVEQSHPDRERIVGTQLRELGQCVRRVVAAG